MTRPVYETSGQPGGPYRLAVPEIQVMLDFAPQPDSPSGSAGELTIHANLEGVRVGTDGVLCVRHVDLARLWDRSELTRYLSSRTPGFDLDWSGLVDRLHAYIRSVEAGAEAEEADWVDVPLPRSMTEVPSPLHRDALLGVVGRVARATVDLTGCDLLSPVVHILVLAGVVLPARIREAHLDQPAREYALIVGPTGASRKGTVYAAISKLLRDVDDAYRGRVIGWQGGSGEGLLTRLADSPEDPRMALFIDEFGQVLAQAQRSGQTVLAALRSLWNPEGSVDIATRREPVHVEGAHLVAVMHATPEEVQIGFRVREITTGLVNRLLVARLRPAEYRLMTGQYPEDVQRGLVMDLTHAVSKAATAPDVIPYSTEAASLWRTVKPDLETPGPAADMLARGAGHVARLALTYCLLDGRNEIEVADLRAALAVWHACRTSSVLLFGAITGDPLANRIYAALDERGGSLTRTQLRDALGRHGHRADVEASLVLLQTRGLIRRQRRGSGSRSTERIDLLGRAQRDIGDLGDLSPTSGDPMSPMSLSSLAPPAGPGQPSEATPSEADSPFRCIVCGSAEVYYLGAEGYVCRDDHESTKHVDGAIAGSPFQRRSPTWSLQRPSTPTLPQQ